MRQRAKKDTNHNSIGDALLRAGASVWDTSGVGSGFPDIVVGFRGNTFLLEVKDGAKPLSQRKLTTDETAFHMSWRGKCAIVNNEMEALKAIGAV